MNTIGVRHMLLYSILVLCAIILPGCRHKNAHKQVHRPIEQNRTLIPEHKIQEMLIPLDQEERDEQATADTQLSLQSTPENRAEEIDQDTTGYRETEPSEESLDFRVENDTGKTIYVVCFSYIRKHYFGRWRWDKSAIYKMSPADIALIDIDFIPDEQDRKHIFGYLAIFDTEEEAEAATFELISDQNLLDLDLLYELKDKKVTLSIEKYGFKGEFFEFDFVKKKESAGALELDFSVENRTGKTILVAGFIYEKKAKGSWFGAVDEKDDMSVWRFDKTPLLKLNQGESGIIDVDTIKQGRDRTYVRGYLAIFDENEEQLARDATYELLESWRKLNVGRLEDLANQKIVLGIEQYGIDQDFIDFVIKEPRKIQMIQEKQ